MGAVRMLAGHEVRRRWRHVVFLMLLVGVVGAIVLSTVAGARRTSSALSRFNASSRAASLELFVGYPTAAQLRAFARVENVAAFAALHGGAFTFPKAPQLQAIAEANDNRFGTVVDRPRVVAGRLARPGAIDEVNVGEGLATELNLRVGDHLAAETYSKELVAGFLSGAITDEPVPDGPNVELRVVGIVRRPLDLGDRGASGGVLVLTPAFTHRYQNEIGDFNGTILRVRTAHGAQDVATVGAAARRIFGQSPQFGVQDLSIDTHGAQNAIDVLSVALWVFAGVSAIAGIVAIGIVLSRTIASGVSDQAIQRSLGMTRRQRVAAGGLQALPVAVGGAVLAIVGAVLASPLFPIGVARRAEPDPGLHVDSMVLVLGVLVVVVTIAALGFAAALYATRRRAASEYVKRGPAESLVDRASRAGVSPVATTGVRMAVERGSGTTAVPVRSAIFGAVLGVLGVVAVLVFVSSLDHLVATNALSGWKWDFAVPINDRSAIAPDGPILSDPKIAAVEQLTTAGLQFDGRPVIGWGYSSLRGSIEPEIAAGRRPRGGREIAFGAATLDELGKSVGDTVRGEGPDGKARYTIVGRAVFPKLDNAQPLANGALLTKAGLGRILSDDNPQFGSPSIAVRVKRPADLVAVERRVTRVAGVDTPLRPTVPVEVDRLRAVNWLPVTLAALLAFLALLAVGHAVVTSVRRRRRDLAVLKTLGFDRRQIRASVAWQATTLATVGLVIGIPLGILVGSVVWRQVADGLGVVAVLPVPALAVLLLIPAAIIAVNLIAFFPARAAARTRAAVALRTE